MWTSYKNKKLYEIEAVDKLKKVITLNNNIMFTAAAHVCGLDGTAF